ncbi:MAG: hypothetical protein EPO61_13650 [Nitrospirae bacterium]|nr:MAG: hypothetical protein EPO61_13650 [Nitrospirota bacterium]
MAADDPTIDRSQSLAAALSLLAPGLGQAIKRQAGRSLLVIAVTGILLIGTWGVGKLGGTGAAVLCFMLLGLPWWAFQSYDAWLPPASTDRWGFKETWRRVWTEAHDIRYLGLLFLLTAATDFYIIVVNPSYALTVFCAKPAGLWGLLAKAQSPTLHILIGYGFLRLRRWGLLLYVIYAAFGFLNASANFACFGYGRVRTVFLLTLAAFTAYVLWRAPCFSSRSPAPGKL